MSNAPLNSEVAKNPLGQRKVNGRTIIASTHAPGGNGIRNGYVILAVENGRLHPYVTAWIGADTESGPSGLDSQWGHGHYFTDGQNANSDYRFRAKRGY